MDGGITPEKRRSYAVAFLTLGMTREALAEIEKLPAGERESLETVALLIDIEMECAAWGRTVDLAKDYAERRPRDEKGWISWAYALRELERIEEAREVLLKAEPLHGEQCALLHYNLACYFCLLGDVVEARRRLARAVLMDASFVEVAKTDNDLRALRG